MTTPAAPSSPAAEPWRDPTAPVDDRVEDLLARMSLVEKCAQLQGVWVGVSPDGGVAPLQDQTIGSLPPLEDVVRHGIGQLARTFGTRPVDPGAGAAALRRTQELVSRSSRFGIPAIAHEECLTGLAAFGRPRVPTPPGLGGVVRPESLIREMARAIGG